MTVPSEKSRADVVITICSSRKNGKPQSGATPASLPIDTQEAVQVAWLERVRGLPSFSRAGGLYAGRGFSMAAGAAATANAGFYVISAGLGLVPADRQIPMYGLTVSRGRSESISARVKGDFDPSAWFSGLLLSSPLSDRWVDVIGSTSGRVLIALTRPYATMVADSLSAMEPKSLARLRIFGLSLAAILPAALHPALAPYDDRLDAIFPGTRADFSQRAMRHFAGLVSSESGQGREADYAAVTRALADVAAPARPSRPRRTDAEILTMIGVRLQSQRGIARILRSLRDEEGIACEQSRFTRLYRIAVENRKAS